MARVRRTGDDGFQFSRGKVLVGGEQQRFQNSRLVNRALVLLGGLGLRVAANSIGGIGIDTVIGLVTDTGINIRIDTLADIVTGIGINTAVDTVIIIGISINIGIDTLVDIITDIGINIRINISFDISIDTFIDIISDIGTDTVIDLVFVYFCQFKLS
jgi:hypothetical protein